MTDHNSSNKSESTNRHQSCQPTSRSLIEQLRANDTAAWERMVHLYSPLVYFWCQKTGLRRQDIPDVFQDVFRSVAQNVQKFQRNRTGSFRGWLRTITKNKATDYFRKMNREPLPAGGTEAKHFIEQFPATNGPTAKEQDSVLDFEANEESRLQRELLKQALANIKPHFLEQTWRAFWMVVMEGRSAHDVADELSMKPGTVRVAKSRVLKRLRQEIGEADESAADAKLSK